MGRFDPTHALTFDGGASTSEVHELLGPERLLRRVLSRMDGREHFALSLWKLPDGARLWDPRPPGWPLWFLQAAGAASGMMVEVRTPDEAGEGAFHKLGRRTEAGERAPLVEVAWRERVDRVPSNEVFTAEEAGDIFVHYYRTGTTPQWCTLRRFE